MGALFVRKKHSLSVPLLIGGHQEHSRRAGTENTTGIIALGKAAELASHHMDEENTKVKRPARQAGNRPDGRIPDTKVNGDPEHRLPNTSNISFGYVEGEAILLMMDQAGHLRQQRLRLHLRQPGAVSHVLRAMGVPFTFAHGSIRFSLSRFNTEQEIDFVLDVLPGIIQNLRKLSPFSPEKAAPACTKAFSE